MLHIHSTECRTVKKYYSIILTAFLYFWLNLMTDVNRSSAFISQVILAVALASQIKYFVSNAAWRFVCTMNALTLLCDNFIMKWYRSFRAYHPGWLKNWWKMISMTTRFENSAEEAVCWKSSARQIHKEDALQRQSAQPLAFLYCSWFSTSSSLNAIWLDISW